MVNPMEKNTENDMETGTIHPITGMISSPCESWTRVLVREFFEAGALLLLRVAQVAAS